MKNQSQELIKLLKSFYEAASRGDSASLRAALDPNVEWVEPNVPGLWFGGTHRGVEAVWKDVMAPAKEKFEDFRLKMRRFYAVGDHVIAIGFFHGRSKITGKELDAATAQVCTVRNDKIVRLEAFHDSANWLETLGLAHPEPQRIAA